MHIIDRILLREGFADNPPVLLDIGASGSIHHKWKRIARHSICIIFDADEREMGYAVKESSKYKKLYIYNRIVTDKPVSEAVFYFTRSPYCSSLLKPDNESLNNWAFAELFEVERKTMLKTTTLPQVLNEIGIRKVDWFKTDSQGTDLRLFDSLSDNLVKRVLAVEFEPGIIDAYEGEDKLFSLMAYMEKLPYWMTSLNIKGSQRINREISATRLSRFDNKNLSVLLKTSPGWGEVSYLHTFAEDSSYLDKRDFLLGWVFAIVEQQYGFALEIAVKANKQFQDPIFAELEDFALKKIKRGYLKLPFSFITRVAGKLLRITAKLIGMR